MNTFIFKKLLYLTPLILITQLFAESKISQKTQVGAYYYLWYPKNFQHGYLRKSLNPPQKPLLGHYDSKDPKIISKHIQWANHYGIDFLAIDIWPSRKEYLETFKQGFLKSPNINDIKFCFFYETWSLGFNNDTGSLHFTDEKISPFIHDIKTLSNMFNHPSYLKINNRPVLIFYLTRTFTGQYAKALKTLRKELKQIGFDLFLIGDEVFWKVAHPKNILTRHDQTHPKPLKKRIRLFDAVTAYNIYETEKFNHEGYAYQSEFLHDVSNIYFQYKTLGGRKTAFIPGIIPGYNDRGVRYREDHYVIPRQWKKNDAEGSFFKQMIQRTTKPFMDNEIKITLITSFNEWNEDTAIEPLKESPYTSKDLTDSKNLLTQDYSYKGFGFDYLKVIRDEFVSFYGSIQTDKTNSLTIELKDKNDQTLQTTQTSTDGFYRFSKDFLKPDEKYFICSPDQKIKTPEFEEHKAILIK